MLHRTLQVLLLVLLRGGGARDGAAGEGGEGGGGEGEGGEGGACEGGGGEGGEEGGGGEGGGQSGGGSGGDKGWEAAGVEGGVGSILVSLLRSCSGPIGHAPESNGVPARLWPRGRGSVPPRDCHKKSGARRLGLQQGQPHITKMRKASNWGRERREAGER